MTKTISLRDANQRFAQLVREVEEGREPVTVTRRGEPVVRIVPAQEGKRKLTPAQQRALDALFEEVHKNKWSSGGWKFNRDELYDEMIHEPHPVHPGHDRPRRRK